MKPLYGRGDEVTVNGLEGCEILSWPHDNRGLFTYSFDRGPGNARGIGTLLTYSPDTVDPNPPDFQKGATVVLVKRASGQVRSTLPDLSKIDLEIEEPPVAAPDPVVAALVDRHRSEVAVLGIDQALANLKGSCVAVFGDVLGGLLADRVHEAVAGKENM